MKEFVHAEDGTVTVAEEPAAEDDGSPKKSKKKTAPMLAGDKD